MTRKCWIFLGLIILCLSLTGCNDTITYAAELFKPDKSSCWPCQMYMSAFNAFSSALEKALPLICSNAFKVMTIALAFWLMYKVFPWVVSFSPPNFKEDFVLVLKVLFKAMVVALFLANPDYFYDQIGAKILQPLGDLFLRVSELILASPNSMGIETSLQAKSQNTFLAGAADFLTNLTGSIMEKASQMISGSWLDSALSSGKAFFSEYMLPNGQKISQATNDRMFGELPMQIQSVIWQIYSSLWTGMMLVFQLIQSQYFTAWLAGLFLCFALCQLMLFLPLSFIDAFMRMGIGIILLPIFMVIWIFPIKIFEGMGKKLVELVLAAFFDILFNCIYVAFLVSVLRVYVQEKIPHIFSTDFQGSESKLRESGLYLSWDFLVMFVLIYTVFKLSEQVDGITGQFFGAAGQGTSIRESIKKVGHLAVTTAIATARAVATGGSDLSGFAKVAKEAGNMAVEGMDEANKAQSKTGGEDDWISK